MEGTVLGSRYELIEKIGEGGMSVVYKARCNKLNRFVAVKVLKNEFCNNDEIVEKFKNEAKSIATLSDNNIVNVLDVGTQDDIHYIVMEYVKGKTLKDVIKQVGKMNYETAISIAIQIAKALDCAHRNKIIHRDVKPQNILVTEDGIMKVTDFGIAKSATSATITNTTTIMGSAHYLSPEQAKGSFIDCRTDLYSLGIVLYEMVTGTLPFEADSPVTIALKHIQEKAVEPKQINSKIPDSLNTLINKAMEKDPNKRYQTAKELINDLQKIKDNPNAVIDSSEDDMNQQTIVMSSAAVTEEIKKQKTVNNNDNASEYYDDEDEYEDDDEYYYDDDDDFTSQKRNKTILKVILGTVAVLFLVGLGVLAINFMGGSSSTKEVEVPNIVGEDVDKAKTELENLNLVLVEAETEASDEKEGTILKTNPKAGTKVKEKSEVRVVVSSGSKSQKMPDVREYTLEKAKTILESRNLKVSSTTEQYSDTVPAGEVISQNPEPDTEVSSDEVITLVISLGPKEVKKQYVTVPSVSGMQLADGQKALSDAGINFVVKYVDTQNAVEDGKILSQSATGNVEQGTSVTLNVGKYNKENANNNENSSNNTESNDAANNSENNSQNTETDNNSNTNNNNGTGSSQTGNTNDAPEGPWEDPELNNNVQ